MKATIEVDKKMMDEAIKLHVAGLEKKIKSLEKKLEYRDQKLRKINDYMDLTKDRRLLLSGLARELIIELDDANFASVYEIAGIEY